MREETKGYLFGILAAFFWGTHSVIVRYLTTSIDGVTIAAVRLWIAIAVILIFLLFSKTKLNWHIENKKWFVIVALLGMTANFIFFHLGLEYTTASNAMLLENTAPIFALLFLAVFLKEKINKVDIFAVLITFIGVIIVVLKFNGNTIFGNKNFFGDTLEIMAGAFWAIFMLGSSKIFAKTKDTASRLSNLLKIFLFTAVILSPWLLLKFSSINYQDWPLLILLGVFPTAIAYWLWYEAAARISTIAAILLFNLSIIFTFINASIFLDEKITIQLIIGAMLVLAGITLTKIKTVNQ